MGFEPLNGHSCGQGVPIPTSSSTFTAIFLRWGVYGFHPSFRVKLSEPSHSCGVVEKRSTRIARG